MGAARQGKANACFDLRPAQFAPHQQNRLTIAKRQRTFFLFTAVSAQAGRPVVVKWISLLAVVLVLPVSAMAAKTQVSSQDRSWLIAAHQNNLAEMQSGDLAAKSGHTNAVRNVGRTLATDHEALDAKLTPVARQLGVKLPDHPNAKQRDQMKHFESLSGMKFDKGWVHAETGGHVKAIERTEHEIDDGSNSEIKKLAKSALPVLKKHLTMLRQTATAITGS